MDRCEGLRRNDGEVRKGYVSTENCRKLMLQIESRVPHLHPRSVRRKFISSKNTTRASNGTAGGGLLSGRSLRVKGQ